MKFSFGRLFLLAILIVSPFVFTGCQSVPEDESSIPWARPASWEGGGPGNFNTPGRRGY